MTAREFKTAFEKVWKERVEHQPHRKKIVEAYQRDRTWTEYMLGKSGEGKGFLHAVACELGQMPCREYYTLDCVLYEEGSNLIDWGTYPAGFSAIIEHENGERVEEELWKLLMWRSPLKILIFYDYSDDDKQRFEKHRKWLKCKFKLFERMAQAMDQRHPEGKNSQYLFLVGSTSKRSETPVWRFHKLCQKRWTVEPFK